MGRGPPVAPELWVAGCCSCDPRCSRPCAGGDRACVLVSALEPLFFCLWQLSGTHSPKESFVGRFRHTVAFSAPALHAARAHHAGRFIVCIVHTVQDALVLRPECPTWHHQPTFLIHVSQRSRCTVVQAFILHCLEANMLREPPTSPACWY